MRKLAVSAAGAAIGAMLVGVAPAAAACSNATLSGTYSAIFSGYVGSRVLAVSAVLAANGAGSFQGQLSYSQNGVIYRYLGFSGSYTVNSNNCSGSGSISNSQIGTVNFDFVTTVNGKYFSGVETDSGTAVTMTATR
jgi:hypothetical protein